MSKNFKTENIWKISNEHIKNFIIFVAIIIIMLIAIFSSSFITRLIISARLFISNPEIKNIRDTANNLIISSDIWMLVNEVLRGILIIILIKFIHRIFNKSQISLTEIGLNFDVKQPIYILIGFFVMSALFLLALLINTGIDTVLQNVEFTFSQNKVVILILVALANAFWQEVLFRAYFQKRLINSYGILVGIVVGAFLFTIVHGLDRELELIEIINGTVLFTLVGAIYFLTNSTFFATAIHAAGNFFLTSFNTNQLFIPEQKYRLGVYSIVLIVFLVINKKKLVPNKVQMQNDS